MSGVQAPKVRNRAWFRWCASVLLDRFASLAMTIAVRPKQLALAHHRARLLSRGDHARRLKPMANNGLGVAAYAQETSGPPGPEPRKPKHERAGHARDPAPIHGVAGAVEDRQLDVGPIGREAGRPNDRADAACGEVEGLRLLVGRPDRLIDGARRRLDSPCRRCADRSAR